MTFTINEKEYFDNISEMVTVIDDLVIYIILNYT